MCIQYTLLVEGFRIRRLNGRSARLIIVYHLPYPPNPPYPPYSGAKRNRRINTGYNRYMVKGLKKFREFIGNFAGHQRLQCSCIFPTNHTIPHCIILYHNIPRCITLYHTIPHYTTSNHTIPHYTIYHTIHTIPHDTTRYHPIPPYTICVYVCMCVCVYV